MATATRDERGYSYSGGLEVVQSPLEPTAFHSDPGMEVYHDPTNSWKKALPAEAATDSRRGCRRGSGGLLRVQILLGGFFGGSIRFQHTGVE
jgi:hypothetical protein